MVEISEPDVNGGAARFQSERPDTLDAVKSTQPDHPIPIEKWSVEGVLKTIPASTPTNSTPDSALPFLHLIERLKTTKREGWRRFGISSGESIADHMYRMSIITLLCPPSLASKLDIPRCTKMALIHDMGESIVGDITPVDGVSKSEKARRERETMNYLGQGLLGKYANGVPGEEIRKLWEEYEASETLEATFVHDVDKMELVLQMLEYERRGEGKLDLSEFAWVGERIQLEEMKVWHRELVEERQQMWKGFKEKKSNVATLGQ